MNSEVEEGDFMKIFEVMGNLKKSISEKMPGKYITLERFNSDNRNKRELIEAYLLQKTPPKEKINLLSRIFKHFSPLQYELDSNKILVKIQQTNNMNGEIKNYISFMDENYPYIKEICDDLRRDYAVF